MWIYVVGIVLVLLVTALVVMLDLPWFVAVLFAVVVLGALSARFLYRTVKAKKVSNDLERALVAQGQGAAGRVRPDQEAEIEELHREFVKAVGALKTSRLGRSRGDALYALPWYLIIGPPGAGKSTALRNSGLTFPYLSARGGGVRGVGGTRNCEWWLTNQAVILDTAGRYTTEDDDRNEWLAFLDMLKKHRVDRPLNGLILAVSIGDVAVATDDQLDLLAQRVRERLDEIIGRLRVVVPVYVLFTKCDLMPGFVETFDDLPRTERNQVLGFTLPLERCEDRGAQFTEHFERLSEVLERRVLHRLASERRPDARARILAFPQQIESVRPQLAEFLSRVFAENVYQEVPLLRGAYFTSGTQEGRPIDRVMGAMAQAFGMAPRYFEGEPVTEARSYFLGDLFTRVMFEDRELVVGTESEQRRRSLLRYAIAGTITLVTLVSTVFLARSYVANRALITSTRDMASALVAVAPTSEGGIAALAALEPLRGRLETLRGYRNDGAPWGMRGGLYQGNALEPSVRTVYGHAIKRVLIQPMVESRAAALRHTAERHEGGTDRLSVAEHAQLYDDLREYLLLTEPRESHAPGWNDDLDTFLVQRIVRRWATDVRSEATPAERTTVEGHVRTYLGLLHSDTNLAFRRDAYLVRRVRAVLASVPPAQIAIDRLVSQIEPLGWDVTLASILGSASSPLTATGRVRGAFTHRAWEELMRDTLESAEGDILGERWVLEAPGGRRDRGSDEQQLCALRSEYFARYIDDWKTFLSTVQVHMPSNARDALALTQHLTRGQPPPLEKLMRAVAFHTKLEVEAPTPAEGAAAAAQQGVLQRLRRQLGPAGGAAVTGAIQSATRDRCAGGTYVQRQDVATALSGFSTFGVPPEAQSGGDSGGQVTPVQAYQEQLEFVRDALQTYVDDPTTSEPLVNRLQQARTEVRALIEAQDVGWRSRFDALLYAPLIAIDESSRSAVAGARGSEWCTAVVDVFDRTLRDKYPFARDGQDAALADVADFYRPTQGVVWAFYNAVLKRDIQQSGREFRPIEGHGLGGLYVAALPTFLERSLALTTDLFPPGSNDPRVDFDVRIRPTPGVATTVLVIDGQRIDYQNGPEEWHRMRWPGPGDEHSASLRVRGVGVDERVEQAGEWGLFRLFDAGTVQIPQGERFFSVAFRLRTQNVDVIIDIRPSRSDNPFVPLSARQVRFLEPFRATGVPAPRSITPSGHCGG
ncbi:MAG: type VI secretion system membrane subunit TssM [Polyangiales bacterium]